MFKRFSDYRVIRGIAAFLFAGVLVGVVIEMVAWEQIPDEILYPALGVVFILSIALWWYSNKLAKRQTLRFKRYKKTKNVLWQIYKHEQVIAVREGGKGLSQEEYYIFKTKARQKLNMPTIHINHVLNDEEATEVIFFIQKNMKLKMKKDKINVNKHTIQSIGRLSVVMDECNVGIKSVMKVSQKYRPLKEKLKSVGVLEDIPVSSVKSVSGLSTALNSMVLAYSYFKPDVERAMGNITVPIEVFTDGFDDMFRDRLNKMGN